MNTHLESSATGEHDLLAAARAGDGRAFAHLVEPHRAGLLAHCYRMLGSVHDAEDALQDALLLAWRALPRFEGRSAPRTWLFRIATNVCLKMIERRPKRVLPIDYPAAADFHSASERPAVESAWMEPYPDERLGLTGGFGEPEARYEQRESVELAFIVALQQLPARQRAALILREVLGFSAREVAEALETSVASVNSALQRARRTVEQRLPDQSQQAALRSLGDERLRELVQDYVDAWERGDAEAILAMLAEDATFAMPPETTWYRGHEAIATFLSARPLTVRWRVVPLRANGQLAFGTYSWNRELGAYVANAIDVLAVDGAQVKEITAFLTPALFSLFELPDQLPPVGAT